jgi:mannose-6-phosphate isomerase-like protein (cupin superfamily)
MTITVLLFSLLLLPAALGTQTPPPQQPPPPAPQPAPATPRPTAPRTPAPRTTMVITVTDPTGATLSGVHVALSGAGDRESDTDDNGTVRFANIRTGTYRVRFSGEDVVTFEREVTVRGGQSADVEVVLNHAEPTETPQPEPAPAPPATPSTGPAGQPKTVSILTLLEKEIIRKEPRKETALGCSGNGRAMMIQINEQQPERLYENAESFYYVIGGEGTLRLNGRESPISTSDFLLVPRGTSYALTRKGKRPLIMIAMLSGEPCEQQQ